MRHWVTPNTKDGVTIGYTRANFRLEVQIQKVTSQTFLYFNQQKRTPAIPEAIYSIMTREL